MVRTYIIAALCLGLFGSLVQSQTYLSCYSGLAAGKTPYQCSTNQVCKKVTVSSAPNSPVYSCSSDIVTAYTCNKQVVGSETETICYCQTSLCNGGERISSLGVSLATALALAVIKWIMV